MKQTIDTQIEQFEKELRTMDEQLLIYGHRIKSMRDYVIKLKEVKK